MPSSPQQDTFRQGIQADINYAGRIIGNYHLVKEIGAGSIGRVYLAEHVSLKNAKGEALLADFSIAVALDLGSDNKAEAVGTPTYMAPEQFQGVISKSADQYSPFA